VPARLSPTERALFTRRRKEIYEALHPETRQGGAPGVAGGGKAAKDDKLSSFATDTAAKTGRSGYEKDANLSSNNAPPRARTIQRTHAHHQKKTAPAVTPRRLLLFSICSGIAVISFLLAVVLGLRLGMRQGLALGLGREQRSDTTLRLRTGFTLVGEMLLKDLRILAKRGVVVEAWGQ
jgi:hypothetical protein